MAKFQVNMSFQINKSFAGFGKGVITGTKRGPTLFQIQADEFVPI